MLHDFKCAKCNESAKVIISWPSTKNNQIHYACIIDAQLIWEEINKYDTAARDGFTIMPL